MVQIALARAVAPLSDVGVTDTALVGGKGANLGELIAAGFPVPPGFVVTADAYLAAPDPSASPRELERIRAASRALQQRR